MTGSVSDGNSYGLIAQQQYGGGSGPVLSAWQRYLTAPLLAGSVITYTTASPTNSGDMEMSVAFVAGASAAAPVDTASVNAGSGTKPPVTLKSGPPAYADELVVAFAGNGAGTPNFFPYTMAPGWSASPPGARGAGSHAIVGGSKFGSVGPQTFDPAASTTQQDSWAAIIFGVAPQPYDLSGLAGLQATIGQMVADQASRAVKFAGGSETWLDNPTGQFTAIFASGGSALPTTTNNVRALLTTLRATFDVLTASPGAAAENIAIAAAVPPIALQAGTSRANGPVAGGGGSVQQTAYDLSGIAALQATANQMVSDQLAGGTQFVTGAFAAIFVAGGPQLPATMNDIRGRLARLRVLFDQLAQ